MTERRSGRHDNIGVPCVCGCSSGGAFCRTRITHLCNDGTVGRRKAFVGRFNEHIFGALRGAVMSVFLFVHWRRINDCNLQRVEKECCLKLEAWTNLEKDWKTRIENS